MSNNNNSGANCPPVTVGAPSVPTATNYPTITTNGWTTGWVVPMPPPIVSVTPIQFDLKFDVPKEEVDHCHCKKCNDYFEYAEANQPDGTLICWACRHGY